MILLIEDELDHSPSLLMRIKMKKISIGFAVLILSITSLFAKMDEWRLRIGVKSDCCQDTFNFIGVSKNASLYYDAKDLPEPPAQPTGLSLNLYFQHEDWDFLPGKYATDIRPPIWNIETFEFVVNASEYKPLALFWPDMEKVPKVYRFVLVDEERNISVNMRETKESVFYCRPGEKNRFRIIVENRHASILD